MTAKESGITDLLRRGLDGDVAAREAVFNRLYADLHALAAHLMRREADKHSWQPTGLVHETYIRLFGNSSLTSVKDREYFFGAVIRVMRRLLVEHSRADKTAKRGGHYSRLPLDDRLIACASYGIDLSDLRDALHDLRRQNDRQCTVLELRLIGNFQVQEIAAMLEIDESTVYRDFVKARSFLFAYLRGPRE